MADKNSPLIEMIYDQVNEVLGGNNTNQFFTMMFPGTLLNQDDFLKGPDTNIELRCPNLVNSLLDVCEVTGGHNGRTLPEQYRAALDNLLPKLNPAVERKRHALREALKEEIQVTLPDKTKGTMTKIEWFYLLVEKYNAALAEWGDLQTAEQKTIGSLFPNPADASKREDAFNTWFAVQSPAALASIQQAHVKVTTVFSSDEESLINSLLDGGDGAITRQKQALETAANHYPKGTSYPAMFTPSDWPSMLATDFGYVDMLKSPEAIALKIANTKNIIDTALTNLNLIKTKITDKQINDDMAALTKAQSDYDAAKVKILNTYTDNAATAAKIYLSKHADSSDKALSPAETKDRTDSIAQLTTELEKGADKDAVGNGKKDKTDKSSLNDADVKAIVDGQKEMIAAQQSLQTTGQAVATAALKKIGDEAQYLNLKPYFARLGKAAKDLADLEDQLATASLKSPNSVKQIFPDAPSERFTQILLTFQRDNTSKSSSLSTSFKEDSWSVDLFFGSASGTKSTSSSDFQQNVLTDKTDFTMGFLAAKVEINRDWFEPGVFGRTADMHSIGTTRISKGRVDPKHPDPTDDTILPTFPTAFVIAKDITINMSIQEGATSTARSILDKHESESGGFACFSVSHNSADHQDNQSFSSHVQGSTVVIRLAAPQIIGWYQEFVPADKSQPVTDDDDGFGDFLSNYKAVANNPPKLLQAS